MPGAEASPEMQRSRSRRGLGLCALGFLLLGCASPPEIYKPTPPAFLESQLVLADGPQIEVGRPLWLVDGLNHYVLSLPTKLILFNWRLLDHELRAEDRALLERYLAVNEMRSVKIRHNQYAPLGELRRLIANREVGPFYRATFGLLSWLRYTLLPDRLLAGLPLVGGGDQFNPFTNSIHVYSSDPAVLLHEAGHAKDYLLQRWKGTWALLRLVPPVDLIQEAFASADAVRFLSCIEDTENEVRAYEVLIPAYSTYVGSYVGGGLLAAPVVLGGHVVGRRKAAARADAIEHGADEIAFGAVQRRDLQPEACEVSRQTLTLPDAEVQKPEIAPITP